jgi:UDP-N-acetylglucosamine/UDP-N-acetylgalactosamine 4-epimerase
MYNTKFHQNTLEHTSFLVTGGAGFIGSNIVDYLMKYGAKKVRVLDNLLTGSYDNIKAYSKSPNFEFIEGDIRDLATCHEACKDIDIILHQAALGSVPRSINDPITTNEINISGFLNVLVAARDAKVKRMVYAASSSTYGDSKNLPKVEHIIGNPLSPYAVTKYVNELYANVFAKLYGLELIGLRYFNVFGPKQNPSGPYAAVIPLFIQSMLTNTPPTINGDGSFSRDFTYVENAVQANIKAAFIENSEAINQIYNIAAGEQTSLKELWEKITAEGQSSLPANYGPQRVGDIPHSLADTTKATTLLHYRPEFSVEKGIKEAIIWYKANFSIFA